MTSPDSPGPRPPLLPLRSALVLLLGILSGICAAVLWVLSGTRSVTAVLIGLGVVAPAVVFFNQIIN